MLVFLTELIVCSRGKLNNKLGQRGAEMVEYAIVLACIAAVGIAYYSVNATYDTSQPTHAGTTLKSALDVLWGKIAGIQTGKQ